MEKKEITQQQLDFLRLVAEAPDETPLTTQQAGWYIGMGERFLEEDRRRGGGIPYIRVSSKAIRYSLGELRRIKTARTLRHTQQEVSA